MDIINISNLVKRFGNIIALDNVNLNIPKNEIFGLIGANGAGKSTIIKILSGLLRPDSGNVHIFGMDIINNALKIKKNIGIVPQDIAIYENISTRENLEFFASLYGIRGKTLNTRIGDALEFVDLFDKQKDKPKSFSGGMKRKLNIACSILHKPDILIMDEPTVGIDTHSRNQIIKSVKKLNSQGMTIVYTTHYIDEAEELCNKVGIIDNGKVIACGNKSELKTLTDSKETITIDTVNLEQKAINEIKKLKGILNVASDKNFLNIVTSNLQNNLQDILFILFQNNITIKNVNIEQPTLESVYLALTGKSLRC
ncbi:ABC transporter ATP-binding protein [Herbivorax sp. ANBcel31]|uniref:ABC transporter ATP-binding protein n=1 Tax=Herbivorax sp. ANBcel31 TaxID=3069754 RepID=UPI0027B5C701|nr:ABC transporter ATP-binding protein [Herbivorax sp. ANBcel31]MDQ2085037.1 ABC transporter ATP-binding protein [Herbivorax sp. ANBcel31]